MNEILDINDTIFIIEHSELEDVIILSKAYSKLVYDTSEDETKQKYIILKTKVDQRIKDLR